MPAISQCLPQYLAKDIERVQKRALRITNPDLTYSDALKNSGIPL